MYVSVKHCYCRLGKEANNQIAWNTLYVYIIELIDSISRHDTGTHLTLYIRND